jgi:hypothetical protein
VYISRIDEENEGISHRVRSIAASNSRVKNRYTFSNVDGRIDLECSRYESGPKMSAVTKARIDAAKDGVWIWRLGCVPHNTTIASWRHDRIAMADYSNISSVEMQQWEY